MVPLLVLFLDMKLVVPVACALAVVSGILLIFTFETRRWIRKDFLILIIPGAIIGTLLGVYVLASYKNDILKKLLGVLIAGYALKMLIWNKGSLRKFRKYTGLIAGFFSGCLGGMFNMGGPPVIMYLERQVDDKRAFRATLVLFFLVTNSWQFAMFCYANLVNQEVLIFMLSLLPAFIVGNIAGSMLHIRINDVLFNKIVSAVLLVTGVFLIF